MKKVINSKPKICLQCRFFLKNTDMCRMCERENIRKGKPYFELDEFFKKESV